jgi:hypothetical protein
LPSNSTHQSDHTGTPSFNLPNIITTLLLFKLHTITMSSNPWRLNPAAEPFLPLGLTDYNVDNTDSNSNESVITAIMDHDAFAAQIEAQLAYVICVTFDFPLRLNLSNYGPRLV